jgi:hypothetical protein
LHDAAADGAFDLIAAYSPERLAHTYAYRALLLEEFRKAGCEVAFGKRPISDDPHGQSLRGRKFARNSVLSFATIPATITCSAAC